MKEKIKQLKKWLLESRIVRILFAWSKRLVLPGFGGMSLFGVIKYVIESFRKSAYGMRSSAIAFKFFFGSFSWTVIFCVINTFRSNR